MSFLGGLGNEKGTYGGASENMDMVEMSEDLDGEFCGKVLDGGVHLWGGEIWNLGDEARGRM